MMNSRQLCWCALLVGIAGLMTGCQSKPVPQWVEYSPGESVYVTTPDLAELLRFSSSPMADRSSANMDVAVPAQSLAGERLILDYHFVWYDERGIEVPPAMGWREMLFEPGQMRQFSATAPNARATGWRLEVRWANR